MAKQDPHPKSWHDKLSDGCSGVLDFKWVNRGILSACLIHDCDTYWGGPTRDMKFTADLRYHDNTAKAGWLGRLLAPGRYRGVRRFTWNYPPRTASLGGPPDRRYDTIWEAIKHGHTRIETWNWLGPGRGKHVGMEAQDHLLPEQEPEVA